MWIILIALAAWFYWGNLGTIMANQFWGNDAAPWERVTAVYYPNNMDMSKYQIYENLKNVDDCQRVSHLAASLSGDAAMTHSSYICNIGKEREDSGLTIYRTNAK